MKNPILPGFNPDPSILRVGDDYFIATSTFEWFPGVQIHHSRDLVHWRLLTRPLTRVSQLDLRGVPRSGGVWAPCLSHSNGTFYLIFTNVKNWGRNFADTHNYLVTAKNIEGPWSEPTFLNSSGFDPSLFHDDDGRKWLVNMRWDYRMGKNPFSGILLQEYSEDAQRLVGPITEIYAGTGHGLTEGPHIYKRDGTYYLLVAEGGTSWEHQIAMARSQALTGPYASDPKWPLITSLNAPEALLQKAGHGSLVETQTGEWYLAHLTGRPLLSQAGSERPEAAERRCPLGRETALQKVIWDEDGWPRLAHGTTTPADLVVPAGLLPHPFELPPLKTSTPDGQPEFHDFDEPAAATSDLVHALPLAFQTLRTPADASWLSLSVRPGHLRITGRESLRSLHTQSLVARRRDAFQAQVTTVVDFEPAHFQHLAGLVAFYDDQNFYYAAITHDEDAGRCLVLLASQNEAFTQVAGPVPLLAGPVTLSAGLDGAKLQFFYSMNGAPPLALGPAVDGSTLSDEHTTMGIGFTGTFLGMACHDLSGQGHFADFDSFHYERRA